MTDDPRVLLIEDNPGDARLIEALLDDAASLSARAATLSDDNDAGGITAPELLTEGSLADGLGRLAAEEVDLVLLDLGLPDSVGLETLDEVLDAVEYVPVVVLTGNREPEIGIRAVERGAQDYLVKDEINGDVLLRSLTHAIERKRRERLLERQRDQLAALDRLNVVVRGVVESLIESSGRTELERQVCERLVEAEPYDFAWIGGVDRGTDRVTPRAAAGDADGYLDEVTVTIGEESTGQGPTGRAIRSKEIQVVADVATEATYGEWREKALERNFHSTAAIPIRYEGRVYGTVNVYTHRKNAFTGRERELIDGLGEIVGHALAAIERKEALVSETYVELDVQVSGRFGPLIDAADDGDYTISFERTIPADDRTIQYVSVNGIDSDRFAAGVEDLDYVVECRLIASTDDGHRFESVCSELPIQDAVVPHGGRISGMTVSGDELRASVEVPASVDVRSVIAALDEVCLDTELVAQRTVDREGPFLIDGGSLVENQLTDRQRSVLETAYFAGFFDWPRESTGEEIASMLDISPATYSQHLRTAERRLFGALLEGTRDEPADE